MPMYYSPKNERLDYHRWVIGSSISMSGSRDTRRGKWYKSLGGACDREKNVGRGLLGWTNEKSFIVLNHVLNLFLTGRSRNYLETSYNCWMLQRFQWINVIILCTLYQLYTIFTSNIHYEQLEHNQNKRSKELLDWRGFDWNAVVRVVQVPPSTIEALNFILSTLF